MEKVILRYDGAALAEHSISLDTLSDALSGLSSLVKEVHHDLNGDDADLDVRIEAGFEEGSFEFILNVIENTNLSTLAAIGFGAPVLAGGLIGALKWLKGEKIERISFNADGNCLVFKEDGEHIEVPGYLKDILVSPGVRKSVKKLIQSPLNKDGVEVFEVLSQESRDQFTLVEEHEAICFKNHRKPVIDKVEEPEKFDDILITFLSVHADKKSGWRINWDDEIVTVNIADMDFFKRISNETIFDDSYRVRIDAAPKLNSIEKTYTIEEVYL
jgi:hypothetical protein